MAMTLVVATAVRDRFRGFLASCMCEIAPGVYAAPRMNAGVRERVWRVLEDWFDDRVDGSIVMTWPDRNEVAGLAIWTIGVPRTRLAYADGIFLAVRDIPSQSDGESGDPAPD